MRRRPRAPPMPRPPGRAVSTSSARWWGGGRGAASRGARGRWLMPRAHQPALLRVLVRLFAGGTSDAARACDVGRRERRRGMWRRVGGSRRGRRGDLAPARRGRRRAAGLRAPRQPKSYFRLWAAGRGHLRPGRREAAGMRAAESKKSLKRAVCRLVSRRRGQVATAVLLPRGLGLAAPGAYIQGYGLRPVALPTCLCMNTCEGETTGLSHGPAMHASLC